MTDAAQVLIDRLSDIQALAPAGGSAGQIGLAAVLVGAFYARRRRAGAEDSGDVRAAAPAEDDPAAAEDTVAEATRPEVDDPDSVLRAFETGRRDDDRQRLIRTAEAYVGRHRTALAEACRILAGHHLSRQEDGPPALDRARAAAMGWVAAAPTDREARLTLDETEAMIRVETATPVVRGPRKAREARARLRESLAGSEGELDALLALGDAEFAVGRRRTALAFFERAAEVAGGPGGPGRNSRTGLACRKRIADALLFAGRYGEAEAVLKPLAAAASDALGPDDALTQSVRFRLGDLLRGTGRSRAAEAFYRDLLTLRETPRRTGSTAAPAGGSGPPPDAGAPSGTGATSDALLPLREKVEGLDQPRTLSTLSGLAGALLDQGRAAEAEALWREILPVEERVRGPEDPDTLLTRYGIAQAMLARGRATEAEALWREILPLQERVRGPEHPDTLSTRHSLARALLARGRAAEAGALWYDLLPLEEKIRGPEDPRTLATLSGLAHALLARGRAAEAEAVWRELLYVQEEVRGPEHPETLAICSGLAHALLDQDRATEAEALWRDLLPVEEKVRGPEHPETLLTRYSLGQALFEQGRVDEAEALWRDLLSVEQDALGPDHPDTLNTRSSLAHALLARGRAAEAEALWREILPIRERVLGAEHPDTLRTQRMLAWAAFKKE